MTGYRSLNNALAIIKKNDNSTDITAYYLRYLCKTGQIMVLSAGSKYLINMESLCDFLKISLKEN